MPQFLAVTPLIQPFFQSRTEPGAKSRRVAHGFALGDACLIEQQIGGISHITFAISSPLGQNPDQRMVRVDFQYTQAPRGVLQLAVLFKHAFQLQIRVAVVRASGVNAF